MPSLSPVRERQQDLTSQARRQGEQEGAGRRKGHFKAHKITENRTAQEACWLLPKLCRFVQILCKSTTRRWQGALADSQALEPSHQSVSVQGGDELLPHNRCGDRFCSSPGPAHVSHLGAPPPDICALPWAANSEKHQQLALSSPWVLLPLPII